MANDDNSLGQLNLEVGADTSKLDASSVKVKRQLQEMANNAAEAYAKATAKIVAGWATVATAVHKVIAAVSETIEQADQLGKLSQSLGIGVDQLGRLQYAAGTSGASVDDMSNAMKRLSSLVTQHGPFDQGTLIFQALGISVKDASGNLKSADVVFSEVADSFSKMEDGVQKTDLANQIFGQRVGATLIPMLNKGAAGIRALGDEGVKTGGVISERLVKQASEFNDIMDRVSSATQGLKNMLTENLLPVLKFLAEKFDESTSAGMVMQVMVLGLGDLFKILIVTLDATIRGVVAIGVVAVATAKAVYNAAKGDFKSAFDALQKGAKDISDSWHGLGEDTKKIFGQLSDDGQKAAETLDKKVKPPIIKTAEDIKNALADMLADNSVDPSVKIAKLNAALKAGQMTWSEYGQAVDKALEPLRTFIQANVADALGDNLLSAAQKMDVLNDAVRRGAIGFRQYDKMAKEVYDNQKQNLEDLASMTASTISAIFGQNKGAAIASAIINTAVGITKALSAYPPPYSFAMAALVAASGAAQIASIRSTTQTGGGGTAGSTGSAGAGAQGGAGVAAQAGPQQTLNVVGIDRNSLFTGDAVRGIAQSLINYQKDGGRVILN